LCHDELSLLRVSRFPKHLIANVEPRTISVVLYNLLKNACYNEAKFYGKGGRVTLECEINNGNLLVRTINKLAKMPNNEVLSINAELPKSGTHSNHHKVRGVGISIIKRIARAYSTGGEKGLLRHRYDSKGASVVEVMLPFCKPKTRSRYACKPANY